MGRYCNGAFFILFFFVSRFVYAEVPPVQLAQVYAQQLPVDRYLVSEKFDGVRAYWDGKRLMTRTGQPIFAPGWFTEPLPAMDLDGELWINYGEFELVSGLVRRRQIDDTAWEQVKYLIFDAPKLQGTFVERYAELRKRFQTQAAIQLQLIEQKEIPSEQLLERWLQEVVLRGGEGLILHRKDALHQAGRTGAVLKYKPYQDEEAKVIGHQPGKGKFRNMLGALIVENKQGLIFELGTGFNMSERIKPPAIGSIVTFRYQGKTKNGKPRFARFLRVRDVL
ncbi:DNA ligase [Pseudoalteromonas xiamenensis]|uniref:DNA ligase n=1 Tax=Pseudoalteromonas xiamenensis TaxID=882626 RepID=UPI0027E53D63|nr:DNA ligase [Pseudoalteromonas xiamenensis]WMN60953.1 DNA ligase [Pseudoalteromonas xiamenensis]